MNRNKSTVRPGSASDTDPCEAPTLPSPNPWEADTWPSPGNDDTSLRPGVPTTPSPSGLSALDEALALRHAPLAAEFYELVGVDYEEVAA